MVHLLALAGAIVLAGITGLVALVGTVVGDLAGGTPAGGTPASGAQPAYPGRSPTGEPPGTPPAIPPAMLALYRQAAPACPGLPWSVLAAIGTVESSNGTSSLPGVHRGANGAGAEGPMQFEPATFAAYDRPVPPGGAVPPSPYDPVDAVYAAARMLCADGAHHGTDLAAAIYAYNHSETYVGEVFAVAATLGGP